MITYEQAIRIINELAKPMQPAKMHIGTARGHFLAQNLIAKYDSPPFDNSAVDGFGRHFDDLRNSPLALVAKLQAGSKGSIDVRPGQAVQIFTGGPVPHGIAAISMQEDCEFVDGKVGFMEPSEPGDHIRRAGEDFKAGDTVLTVGTYLGPAQIGIAVSAGHKEVLAYPKPKVSILTSGSELIDVSHELPPWKIYDSNSFSLSTAVHHLTDELESTTASDKPDVLRKKMLDVGMHGDIVITSGGVSVGEHDLLKEEFAHWGVEQRFWQVAIKPGKPVYFGTQEGGRLVFGLPGNPVSALVTYSLFVRPAFLKLMGHPDPWPKPANARFEGECRKNPGRMEFLRGVVVDGVVRIAGSQGSHQLAALAAANCLIHFPLESSELRSGEEVEVTLLRWGLE